VYPAQVNVCRSIIARCLSGVNQNLERATQASLGVAKVAFPEIDQTGQVLNGDWSGSQDGRRGDRQVQHGGRHPSLTPPTIEDE
jgi:hypothetical protein